MSAEIVDEEAQTPVSFQPEEKKICGISLKYFSLICLVLQNSLLILLVSRSRVPDSGILYITSTAILFSEVIKLIMCIIIVFFGNITSFLFIISLITKIPAKKKRFNKFAGVF